LNFELLYIAIDPSFVTPSIKVHIPDWIYTFCREQNPNATSLTLTGISSIPPDRIPLLPAAGAIKNSFETSCNKEANASADVYCNDLWNGHQFDVNTVLLSALLQIEVQCPSECFSAYGQNVGSLEESTDSDPDTCPNVLGAFLTVGDADAIKSPISSYIPNPCLQKLKCSNPWCSVVLDLDLLGVLKSSTGNGAPTHVSLLLNFSIPTRVRTVLSTRSTSQYALSNPNTGEVVVSGATAPDLINGENDIIFRLFVLNPPVAQQSAAHVTIIGSTGVIQGIGVSTFYTPVFILV
jgi:hypothetical protein